MPRRLLIAGNWKMNKGPLDADVLASELKRRLAGQVPVDVLVAPAAIAIPAVVARLRHTDILVAGQDLHAKASGAFTGAISGEMLRQAGCTYVLVGHSERRSLFGDTDVVVQAKLTAALRAGLLPILCIGETLAQRQEGTTNDMLFRQLEAALAGLPVDQMGSVTIAYEPVWAIGTGLTATPDQAQAVHNDVRGWLQRHYAAWVGEQTRILYGGSVTAGSARGLLSQPDIDGALVGGASLDPDSFTAIVQATLS
jgi:triosephosphate isomerase (TIM)